MGNIQYAFNETDRSKLHCAFHKENAARARRFHSTFHEYEPTPLAELKNLAAKLGVSSIHVKDESYRFGLNAFKVLGGSYSIGRHIAEYTGQDMDALNYDDITSPKMRERLKGTTFVTATDGNHGRGVAWTANRLHLNCVVYLPKGSAQERLEHIRRLDAEAEITDMNYDDAVRYANAQAEKNGWVVVQDTSWEGYQKIPQWIMEGYTTMADEAAEQLGSQVPTHIFLQAGVGAMAGAVAGYFSSIYRDCPPKIIVVEPDQADCYYRTVKAADGQVHNVTGDMNSIMAGLCCGEPCDIGWSVLKNHAEAFVSMPDWVAANGMRILANPLGDDPKVVSGESGAAGLGLAVEILRREDLADLKERLGLDENSRILCISTEGDTDRENYRRIVCENAYTEGEEIGTYR